MPIKRLNHDLLYLQLSSTSYEQVAHPGVDTTPTFSGGGLARKRIYDVLGLYGREFEIREYKDVDIHDLESIEFDEDIMISKPGAGWVLESED